VASGVRTRADDGPSESATVVPSSILTAGWLALGTLVVLIAIYLIWTPLAPDLAAQVARAEVVRQSGVTTWWTGWFGGLSLPTYSLLVPSWMATVGVRGTGVLAVLVSVAGSLRLVPAALRPRAGAVAFAVACMADLAIGRVTFAAGLALAVWALVAMREQWFLRGLAFAVASYCASPLAALFLGMILIAIVIVDPQRRRPAAIAAGVLFLVGCTMALLFPGTGTMPFTITDAIPAGLCCAAVIVLCPQRVVRVSAGVVLASFPAFLILHTAVGGNITRLAWVCTIPIVVACSPWPRRLLAGILVLAAIWPAMDLIGQLTSASDSSSRAGFYQALITRLKEQRISAGPFARGERVEVVDTANHWATVYLSSESLARGWDRQADNSDNPIFYQRGALSANSYHSWLSQLAVGWVALPTAPLDYASVEEGQLIDKGLSYLQLTWSNTHWKLYRVTDASPLATGGQVTAVTGHSISIVTQGPGVVSLRLRWSPYLVVDDPVTHEAVSACITNADGWVQVSLPRAETVELTSQFTPGARLRTQDTDCELDAHR
jgi:hypothetical protein